MEPIRKQPMYCFEYTDNEKKKTTQTCSVKSDNNFKAGDFLYFYYLKSLNTMKFVFPQ